tara:strand:- start:1470 stop:1847 length:378 start_codon:yes stop_codon:yes gene_type:complete
MSDPFELAHAMAKMSHPLNHLVVAATDQAYLIGRLQDEVKQLRKERDDAQVDQRLIEELWQRRTDATEMHEEIKKLRSQRDEISIHADVIIKEASALITRCVESRKASAYWNAVEQFRQFESRTT